MRYGIRKFGFFFTLNILLLSSWVNATPVVAGDAVLTWTPNSESDLAGYNVYYRTSSGVYGAPFNAGNQTTYTVTGLGIGTYYFAVTAYDASGNKSGFSIEVSKTFADSMPPVISAIAAGGITGSSASVTWTTNEPATSLVEYGNTTAYGSLTSFDSALMTGHNQVLNGLQGATTYHYRIRSADAAGNLAVSGDNTLMTSSGLDTTPPAISGITSSNLTDTGAVITWNTDEAATSQVEYGTTTAYGSTTALDSTLVTSHTQTLAGLQFNQLYHYRVKSVDGAGILSVSGDLVFTTGRTADTTPPENIQNFSAKETGHKITLNWNNPPDLDFIGVRIRYRTDHYPTDINDGVLLGDFTGEPNQAVSTIQSPIEKHVTYYYSASSYDSSGNYQHTAYASVTTSLASDSSGSPIDTTMSGGCGMIFPTDGRPSGPAQSADMVGLIAVLLIAILKRESLRKKSFNMIKGASGIMVIFIDFGLIREENNH
jgi:Purple acid Phosphatase, N-terminal domain/Fibronectin type III domain